MNEAQALQSELHRLIPLSRAMEVRVDTLDGETLVLSAPLAANHNHAGTAFAGSLYALASLAGWALLRTVFHRAGLAPELVLGEGTMRYSSPVAGELRAHARLPREDQEAFIQRLLQGRRVRGTLEIPAPKAALALYTGRFFATPR